MYLKLVQVPNKIRSICLFLFIGWILVLSKFILFKVSFHPLRYFYKNEYYSHSLGRGMAMANFIPFRSIIDIYHHPGSYDYYISNNIGNIAGFIPLGFLLPVIFPALQQKRKTIFRIFLISLAFETIQFITGLGIFDVDDLLLNTIGGLLGLLVFRLINISGLMSNLLIQNKKAYK